MRGSRILLIHSNGIPSSLLDQVTEQIRVGGSDIRLLKKDGGEPTSDSIDGLFSAVGENKGDYAAIVGLGGGSTLDTAKALALLATSGGRISDYEFGAHRIEGALPLYLIPTTCGSGSEVTPYAVVTNSQTKRKFTLTHDSLRPQAACVNPLFCQGIPSEHMRASVLDAFVHNLEAFLNRQQNQLIEPLALEGMRRICRHFDAGTGAGGENGAAALAMASLLGGVCISHSRTGLIHTLSVALSEFSVDPHGLLNAKLLPHVLRFNCASYAGRLAEAVSAVTGSCIATDAAAAEHLSAWASQRVEGPRLRLCRDVDVDHAVDRILQDSCLPLVNARTFDREDLVTLVQEVIDAA